MEIRGKIETIFITVGTTKFNKLIEVICSEKTVNTLKQLGCSRLIIQFGNGDDFDINNQIFDGIQVTKYRLKPNIIEDIRISDLVISHAGAGSCIEVLRENKPLVVVVNEELMHNHQTELAQKLSEESYLYFCNPHTLNDTLRNSNFGLLKRYQKGSMDKFIEHLDVLMGI